MRSITTKLVLAFITVSLLSTVLVVVFTRWRSGEEFRSFLLDQNRPSIVNSLSGYYATHGSWQGINDSQFFVQPPPPKPQFDHHPFTLVDESGNVVFAGEGYQIGSLVPSDELAKGIPIDSNGKLVGTLLIHRTDFPIGTPGSSFLDRINQQILFAGLIAIVLAFLLAIILSRTLTRPIRELTAATQVVSEGKLSEQVPVRSRDELGQLANSFNRMSSDLSRSLNLRRQMTADIAHELRTPISIILGHAEAVHDGVLPASPETFEIIREEAGRLEHLVDDLRTLSMADAGELKLILRPYSPQKLLQDAQKTYSHRAGQKKISIHLNAAPDLPEINVDPERMKQVLGNIIDNALRYTPDNGAINLSAQSIEHMIEIKVQDSGPGVAPDELDHIFERFYRTESSRARNEGGSGLGFAIAKSLVEKHNGHIWAESKPGEGLSVIIQLPIQANE
ncbi:MAG TPA: ATP-binding protein [Anaerolineales bacterium]|nr:ATP-binding protein [Anaerolineales bacterium]